MPRNDGGPAFPGKREPRGAEVVDHDGWAMEPGMTLRDYYIGQAVNGLLAGRSTYGEGKGLVADAVELADAMLAARDSKTAEQQLDDIAAECEGATDAGNR